MVFALSYDPMIAAALAYGFGAGDALYFLPSEQLYYEGGDKEKYPFKDYPPPSDKQPPYHAVPLIFDMRHGLDVDVFTSAF